MKILKRAKDALIGLKIECLHCGTTQRITAADKYRFVADQRDGDARVYKCGACKGEIWIADDL